MLTLAAVGAAGLATSMAQTTTNVYSVNAVGYVNMTLAAGFTMVANPLINGNNTLTELLPFMPDQTTVYKFDSSAQAYDPNPSIFYDAGDGTGVWWPEATLEPGQGCFINVSAETTVTFVGEVPQGSLTNAIPTGFSMLASIVPIGGNITNVLEGYMPTDQDTVYRFDSTAQGYDSNPAIYYDAGDGTGIWYPEPDNIGVGESFFMFHGTAPVEWVRVFTIGD